ncbi:hypothetical protein [Caulobacter sp. 17J65-9]|nr:hypothetical protein [Caulobacter sp. 17J65-9]
MAEFLLELGINILGGLLEGCLTVTFDQWKRPEVKPFIDLHSL